jgi:hypothetical protein
MRRLTNLFVKSIFVMSALACASLPQHGITDVRGRAVNVFGFPPPAIYEDWWHEIADCEHLPLPADHKVYWFIVPVRPFMFLSDSTHKHDDAAIITSDSAIAVAFVNYSGLLDRGLITHEMAHALLFWAFGSKYVGQHPDEFYTRCGLVAVGQQKL